MPSKIEWTEETWNPVVGCSKCSPGCLNCYAERMAHRLASMGNDNPQYMGKTDANGKWTGKVECCPWILDKPLHWRKPRRIFVCSMCDLFHEKVPFEFVSKVFDTILECPQHIFQILTKRPERAKEYFWDADVTNDYTIDEGNVWLGVTVCNQQEADEKMPILLQIPAAKRFVSLEPLLGPVDLGKWLNLWCVKCGWDGQFGYSKSGRLQCHACDKIQPAWAEDMVLRKVENDDEYGFRQIDQVIVGAESKGGYPGRPCDIEDVRSIIRQCGDAGVARFVKQLHIDGKLVKDITKFPKDLQIREYPK